MTETKKCEPVTIENIIPTKVIAQLAGVDENYTGKIRRGVRGKKANCIVSTKVKYVERMLNEYLPPILRQIKDDVANIETVHKLTTKKRDQRNRKRNPIKK